MKNHRRTFDFSLLPIVEYQGLLIKLDDDVENPYNWNATYWSEGNELLVKGSWRVDNAEVQVQCRIARGT